MHCLGVVWALGVVRPFIDLMPDVLTPSQW